MLNRLFGYLLLAGLCFSQSALAQTLYVYNWSDYFAPETIANFEKATGIKVVHDVYDSNQMLEAKLYAGNTGYDVVFPTNFPYFDRQIQAGIYQSLDKDKLPMLQDADQQFVTPLERDGQLYGAPYLWGTVGFAYDEKKIKALNKPDLPLDSWALVFEPENIKQVAKGCKIAFTDSPIYLYPVLLNYLGLNPQTTDPADYAKATERFEAIRPYITYFHDSQYMNDIANGNICLALGWSGDLVLARTRAKEAGKGLNIHYVNPKEGSLFLYDVMAVPKASKNVDAAQQFINYLMQPKVMAELTDYVGYPNPVPASKAYLNPAVANDPAVFPKEETLEHFFVPGNLPLALERRMNRDWAKMKAGKK